MDEFARRPRIQGCFAASILKAFVEWDDFWQFMWYDRTLQFIRRRKKDVPIGLSGEKFHVELLAENNERKSIELTTKETKLCLEFFWQPNELLFCPSFHSSMHVEIIPKQYVERQVAQLQVGIWNLKFRLPRDLTHLIEQFVVEMTMIVLNDSGCAKI